MSTPLTDVSSFDTMNGPVGADIRNAAGVRTLLQAAANRTRFLADQTAAMADLAALAAVTPANAMVRHVKGIGFYVFDAASVEAEDLPFIVAPSAGAGMWYWSVDAAALRAGLATINGLGKVVEPVPNRLVSATMTPLTAVQTTTSATYVDVPTFFADIACEAGDLLAIDVSFSMFRSSGANEGYARLLIVDNAVDFNPGPTARSVGTTQANGWSFSTLWTATATGTVTVKLQYAAGASSGVQVFGANPASASTTPGTGNPQANLRVLQYRP